MSEERPGRPDAGFTLVEVMVVVIIMGILAAVSIPQYMKTVETSKSDDAQAVVKMIGTTNRMYRLDTNVLAAGALTNACNGAPAVPCTTGANGCPLVMCRYLAAQDWDNKPYTSWAGPGGPCAGGANIVGCVRRRAGASPGTNTPPYNAWGYTMDDTGHLTALGGAPPPQN